MGIKKRRQDCWILSPTSYHNVAPLLNEVIYSTHNHLAFPQGTFTNGAIPQGSPDPMAVTAEIFIINLMFALLQGQQKRIQQCYHHICCCSCYNMKVRRPENAPITAVLIISRSRKLQIAASIAPTDKGLTFRSRLKLVLLCRSEKRHQEPRSALDCMVWPAELSTYQIGNSPAAHRRLDSAVHCIGWLAACWLTLSTRAC